jgi:multidrug efflux pump subunit AcrA (membrane-fusion protein)
MSRRIELIGSEMRVVDALRNAPGGLTSVQVAQCCGWASAKLAAGGGRGGTRATQILASLRALGIVGHSRTRPPVWALTDLARTAQLVRIYQRVSQKTLEIRRANLAAAREALAKSQEAAAAAALEDDNIDRDPIRRTYRPHGTWQASTITAPTSVFDVARMG